MNTKSSGRLLFFHRWRWRALLWTTLAGVLTGMGADSVDETVAGLRLPSCFGDNMVLQRALHGDDKPVIWGWIDPKQLDDLSVSFLGKTNEARTVTDSLIRRVPGLRMWWVTLEGAAESGTGDLLFLLSSGRRKSPPRKVAEIKNVSIGDVWAWSASTNLSVPRLTDSLSQAERQRLQEGVRWTRLPELVFDRPGAASSSWTKPDLLRASPAACFFALQWMVTHPGGRIGIIEIPSPAAGAWSQGNRITAVAELAESNAQLGRFVQRAESLHRRNINQFKYQGILVDDAPLPPIEVNTLMTTDPASDGRASRLRWWPFRALIHAVPNEIKK